MADSIQVIMESMVRELTQLMKLGIFTKVRS